jgi:DNA-binding response OmpR family regulator
METISSYSNILIVNHNPSNLEILDRELSNAGYILKYENQGQNVIKQVHLSIPDLILLDLKLPDISGFEVCKQLKVDPIAQSIPIIFMADLMDSVGQVKGLQLGAVDFITKPFEREILLTRIRTHLDLRQLQLILEHKNQQVLEITEKLENKVAERIAALQIALGQEQEFEQLKSQFISVISHEFRTPLAIISSSSGILQHFGDRLTEEKKQEHLQTIQSSIKNITNLLDNSLMINCSKDDVLQLERQELDR